MGIREQVSETNPFWMKIVQLPFSLAKGDLSVSFFSDVPHLMLKILTS